MEISQTPPVGTSCQLVPGDHLGPPHLLIRSCHLLPAPPSPPALPPRRGQGTLALLTILAVVLFFSRLPCGLLEPEEARYAKIPRQMLIEGRFFTPTWNGEDYLHKPPLLYWLVMLSYSVLGVQDWAARLIPCLAGVATVLIGYLWARALLGRRAAFAGALVLLFSFKFLYLQGMVLFDGLLCLWVILGWAAGHVALAGRSFSWACWLTSATCCALGILTKGPVAAVLIGAPLLFVFFQKRRRLHDRPAAWLLGIVYIFFALGLAAPWFAHLAWNHPEACADFFFLHHVRRFLDPLDHAKPWWFFLPLLAVGMLPWSLGGLPALRNGWRALRGKRPLLGRTAPFWIAGGCCVLLFSLSGCKRAAYILPAFPPLALALGCHLRRSRWLFTQAGPERGALSRPGLVLFSLFFLLFLIGSLVWLPGYHRQFGMREALAPARQMPELSVFCFPRHWDSVSFYLGDAEEVEEITELFAQLEGHEKAWVVLRRRDGYPLLMENWPGHLEFHPQGPEHPNVVLGMVVRRQKAPVP